ncbi:MAG: hypothetical protein ACHBN1_35410 [Heteroscytonema crispum UTEX LB 1556]
MKYRFGVKNLLAIALLLPLMSQKTSQGGTKSSVYQLAQGRSEYNRLMQQGYAATSRSNYRQALQFFERARRVNR